MASPGDSSDLISGDSHERWRFLRTLQKELTLNQAKVTAKQTVTATRPRPTWPAWDLQYSLKLALVKLRAITRKITPTNSTHSWCGRLPNERAVARPARINV